MSPAALLCEQLASARRRGEAFPTAWAPARDAALSTVGEDWDRRQWSEVLAQTSSSWRRAFERQPAPACETALLALLDDGRVLAPDRECVRCGGEIDPALDRRVKYCSPECKRGANGRLR